MNEIRVRSDVLEYRPIPIFDEARNVAITSLALSAIKNAAYFTTISAFGSSFIYAGAASVLTSIVSNLFLNVFKMGMKTVYKRFYSDDMDLNKILDSAYSKSLASLSARVFKVFVLVIASQFLSASLSLGLLTSVISAFVISVPHVIKMIRQTPACIKDQAQKIFNKTAASMKNAQLLNEARISARLDILNLDQESKAGRKGHGAFKSVSKIVECFFGVRLLLTGAYFYSSLSHFFNLFADFALWEIIKEQQNDLFDSRCGLLESKKEKLRERLNELNASYAASKNDFVSDRSRLREFFDDIWIEPKAV